MRLAALAGLRLSDLVSLTWDHLGEIAIIKTALKKSRGKRRKAIVPMTDELEKLLEELRTRKRKEGVNTERAERLKGLQYRDTRRTCVVTLGELGLDDAGISAITGYKLATIKQILETYMPRTEAMAARAVVARIAPASAEAEKKEQEA